MDTEKIFEGLEQAAFAIVAADRGGKVDYANTAAEALFGGVLGVDLSDPPVCENPRSPLAQLVQVWEESREGGASTEPKIVRAKTGGRPRYLWFQTVPAGGGGGSLLVIAADLTEQISGSEPVRILVAQLAHDLRSPLTSISGAAELLLSGRVGALAAPQERLVKIVDEGTSRLAAIIQNASEEEREGGASR